MLPNQFSGKVSNRSCESPFFGGSKSHLSCQNVPRHANVDPREETCTKCRIKCALPHRHGSTFYHHRPIIIRVASGKATQQELKFKFLTIFFSGVVASKLSRAKHSAPPLKKLLNVVLTFEKGAP